LTELKNENSDIIYFPLKLFQMRMTEDIFKNTGNQTVDRPHWLPQYRKKNTVQVNGIINILQNTFVFSRRKKFIQFWKNLRVKKWWQNIHSVLQVTQHIWLSQSIPPLGGATKL